MSKSKKSKEQPMATTVEAPTVSFDVWFAMREKKIPGQHLREIIWADFKGQGLSKRETLAVYDAGLAKYGITL